MRAYCDGATSNNGYEGAVGGWAFVVLTPEDKIVEQGFGKIPDATNNICELTAAIKACEVLKTYLTLESHVIYSDSAYIVNCYKDKWYKKWKRNGWKNSKKEEVANRELWEKLIPFFEDPLFVFEKVKGHNGDEWNEYVDKMAVYAKEN